MEQQEEQMLLPSNLKVIPEYDKVISSAVSEDEKILKIFYNVCFNSMIYQKDEKKNLKYYDVYFVDAPTEQLKDKSTTELFLREMWKLNVFRNTKEVALLSREQLPDDVIKAFETSIEAKNEQSFVKVRFDVDGISAPEIFFVGCIVRTLANNPQIVANFVHLLEMHTEIETSLLFLISHTLTFGKSKQQYMNYSHLVVPYNFTTLTGKTFADFFKQLANANLPTFRLADSYRHIDQVAFFSKQVQAVDVRGFPKVAYRAGGVKYNKDVIETFFNEDLFKSLYKEKSNLVANSF